MTITVVCDVLGGGNNGTSVAANALIDGMRRRGHAVRVVCCDTDKAGKKDCYVLPQRKFGPFGMFFVKAGVSLAKPEKKTLAAAIDGADVVHCMLPFALGAAAVKIAAGLGVPVTAGFHCQAENFTSYLGLSMCAPLNDYVYDRFYRKVYSRVARVHYPSQTIRDIFERKTAVTDGEVISNGVESDLKPHRCEKPDYCRNAFVILSAGRYAREKKHSVLIRAVAKSRHRADIQLIIAGAGGLEKKYRVLGKKYGLRPIALGFMKRNELKDALGYADLYVHPADYEIEGIACLEAVKSGKTIVVSDSEKSAARLLARDERSLFRTGSAKSLAGRIDYWIEHRAELAESDGYYATCGKARDRAECMDDMERMFYAAAASRKSSPTEKSGESRDKRAEK